MIEGDDVQINCTNCGNELGASDIFCGCCGQKIEQSRITFPEMIKVFFYALFNADSTLWKTLKSIWVPGKLTAEYFSGKRKSYFHPVRLFLFSWVLFFAVFAFSGQIGPDDSIDINLFQNIDKRVNTKKTVNHLLERRDYWSQIAEDSLSQLALDDMVLSSAGILDDELKAEGIDELRKGLDSKKDSLSVVLISPGMELKVAYEDLVKMTDDELFERYNIHGFFNQVVAKQVLKIFRDTLGMIQYLLRGFSWMVLITIPLMSLVLYAMYFYRKHYLVEHVVFLLHIHALFFVLYLLIWLLEWSISSFAGLFGGEPVSLAFLYILGFIYALFYPLIGFRIFYKSSIIGVVLKGFVFLLAYFFVSVFSLFAAMIIRFLLF